MYLDLIRDRLQDSYYSSADGFVRDVDLLVANSSRYNGPSHVITARARDLANLGLKVIEQVSWCMVYRCVSFLLKCTLLE